MELGKKLRQARMEAGLSQRQLCGDEITRNMLSLIENGSAKPSMKTLQYLASRLGKSVSYFLEETAVLSPNHAAMTDARQFYDSGQYTEASLALEAYRSPDEVYDREMELLRILLRLEEAKEALAKGKYVYAAEILRRTQIQTPYCGEALHRQKCLLLGNIPGQQAVPDLPSLDDDLWIHAIAAFASGNFDRSGHLLDAMEQQTDPQWHLYRGQIYQQQKHWEKAVSHLQQAEDAFPKEVYPQLEICYRELENFQKAYEYACKQRK